MPDVRLANGRPQSQRNGSVPRSGSVPRKAPVPRPPSRVDAQVSPSEGQRAGPSPDHVYNVSNARDAQHALGRRPARGPLGAAGASAANVAAKPARASSSGPSAGRAPTSRQGSVEVTRTPVFAYLKVYGLNQYARAFASAGLSELDSISKLSETDALDFLEHLRIYPGHKLRLLRAVECLRHAGADKRNAAQMLEDDAALQRLNSQKEELCREKAEAENESKRCQEENRRLLELVRDQAAQLQKERDRVMDLEDLVQTQTEQVQFLANQLHAMAEAGGPERVSQLFESFRNGGRCSVDSEEWQSAPQLSRDEASEGQAPPLNRLRCNSDSLLDSPFLNSQEVFPQPNLSGYCPPSIRSFVSTPGQSAREPKLAKSMEIPSNLKVDNLIKCLATALHNKIILSVGKPRPHNASIECLAACSIFLEPVCRQILERQATVENIDSIDEELDAVTPTISSMSRLKQKEMPFNAIAIRRIPNQWDIYDFLELVIRSLEVDAEVSVVTLVYLERFCGMSGVAFTPDNWQRLTITAMMLASKVWYDESYENLDFAEKFDLYSLNEINTFERIFLKCVSYDMSVKAVQYAHTYFFLRTLGAKDSGEFTLPPLDDVGALRLQERCLAKQIEFKNRYTGDDKPFAVTTAF